MNELTEPPSEPDRDVANRTTLQSGIALVGWIGLCLATAILGSIATASSVNEWYVQLNKPDWNPPSWVFGPVWTALYVMMGVSAWLVWKNLSPDANRKLALGVFVVHLGLNALWSILFFGLQQPGWAFAEILLLWISILVTTVLFFRISKLAGVLLVPYLGWVTFASVLNFSIWSLNR